jgi:sugar/nucleoside kinase (ribokinase family)
MLEKAFRLASKANMKICMDLASYNIVEENREFFKRMISKYVDILFANGEEIIALMGESVEESAAKIRDQAEIVVVKLGAEGSFCMCNGEMTRIGVRPSKPVDTTGAGDLYASGFIYGHMNGYDAETCGKMGAVLAGRIIELIGAKMDESHWENLRREIKALESQESRE